MAPEVSENFSYHLARHALKFGGSIRPIRDTQVQATAAAYVFPNTTAYLAARDGLNPRAYASFIQTIGEPSIKYNSLFGGFYAQDTWKPRANMTVTYGLRYDVYRPPAADRDAPFEYSRRFRTDKSNVAPRLGIAVGHGKTVYGPASASSTIPSKPTCTAERFSTTGPRPSSPSA
jgi:outer membrane receptor protein involved in Fe transport